MENLKNDDLPTRKPHFSTGEATKNQPKCIPKYTVFQIEPEHISNGLSKGLKWTKSGP